MTRASHRLALLLLLSWPLVAFSASGAEPIDQEGVAFFENKIRPALAQHCYKCHSTEAKSVKGGLLLDTKEATRQGGDSGEAVIPGDLQESLLLSAIRYEDYEMPPSGKLPDAVIAAFEKWVAMGAPDPRGGETIAPSTIDVEQGRQFWAFQPLQLSPLPEVTDEQWPRTEVDRFVLSRLEGEGLRPVRDADRTTLIRRLSLDLIGLPPTLAEIDAFVNDESPQALDAVVDRLLESEQFGERWGRHWLDVARYAESIGRTRNYPFSDAWRYRDYVIDAFNADKPYDEFIVEQLAGDLLPHDTDQQRQEQLIATGFLALGSHDLNERDEKVFEMDVVSEQIDTTSRSMLALTVGCARCHDHKFDPIPTTDYYALAGIFKSTELLNGYQSRQGGGNKYSAQRLILLEKSAADANTRDAEPKLPEGAQAKLAAAEQQLDEARARLQEAQAGQTAEPRVRKLPPLKRQVALKQKQLKNLRRKLRDQAPIKIEGPVCLGVRDRDRIADCQVNIRGDAHRLGESVPRGFIQVAMTADPPALQSGQSGRLALAHWIADPRNPLTRTSDGQSHLASPVRTRAGTHRRQFRTDGRAALASRVAGLSGDSICE